MIVKAPKEKKALARQAAPVAAAPVAAAPVPGAGPAVAPPPLQPGSIVQLFGKLIDPTGQAAAGVGITLGFLIQQSHVANTVSDTNGIFVLTLVASSIPSFLLADDAPVLYLSVNAKPVALKTQIGPLDLNSLFSPSPSSLGGIYGPIYIVTEHPAPAGTGSVAPRARLLGDNATLLEAFKRAPGIFTRPVAANSSGGCSPASPTDMATRVFYLNQITLFPPLGAQALIDGAIDFIDGNPQPEGAVRYGAMLEFQQEWWDLGFSLGDLPYSIPLAPGEETNIATVDWRRQDFAKRQTALDESNFQDTTISRDQAIDEAVNMTSTKTASSTTEGYGGGISLGPIDAGYAHQHTDMNQTVNASSAAATSINDRIHQVSNTLRQTRAFSVVETTQQEQATVSTRVLRNHNHCHTITFQYFEVLRQFQISTKVVSIDPLVFIPFVPVKFSLEHVSRFGYLLRRALVDTTLQPVLDKYLGVLPSDSPTPISSLSGNATVFQVTAYVSHVGGGVPNLSERLFLWLLIDDDLLPPDFGAGFGITRGPGNAYSLKYQYTLPVAKTLSDIQKIGLQNQQPGVPPVSYYLDNVEISTVDPSGSQLLYFNRGIELDANRTFMYAAQGSLPLAGAPASLPSDLTRLIHHLNANTLHYTSVMIQSGDDAIRYLLLANNGWADIVDNRVVGSVGNYVAFPLTSLGYLPPQYVGGNLELPNTVQERLITLPTPGVFAESQMGSCNACEPIDTTRFWDWQKSPTPENAPDITAAMLASRFQDLSNLSQVQTSNLQALPVQIPTEPPPPITIGDQTLSALVSNLNLTDASSVLNLVNGLVSAVSQGYQNMAKANQGSPGMTDGGSDGSGAAGSGGVGGGVGGGGGTSLTPTQEAIVPMDTIMA